MPKTKQKFPRNRVLHTLKTVQGQIANLVARRVHLKARLRKHPKRDPLEAIRERIFRAAAAAVSAHTHYVLGGGHNSGIDYGPHSNFDCSGYGSWLARVGNANVFMDTSAMARDLPEGRGKILTYHILTGRGGAEDHVIEELIDKHGKSHYTECGGRDNTNGGGPCWFFPDHERLSEFHVTVHPANL